MDTQNYYDFSLMREAEIPEGKYQYAFSSIEVLEDVLTIYGVKTKISFIFEIKKGEAIEDFYTFYEKSYYYSRHPQSRFMKFMTMLCQAYKNPRINLKNLIGTSGKKTKMHEADKDGNVFESIAAIEPFEIELAWFEACGDNFE